MLSQRIKSRAKVNLFLYLKGRDHRNYHELQSLFYLLPDLYDLMDFQLIEEPVVKVISSIEDNLVEKAAKLLLREASLEGKRGVQIILDKKIPIGGGFGGGSSNAATTLLTLNRDLNLGASLEDLLEIAEQLGDDVKIFLLEKDFVYLDSPNMTSLDIKLPVKIGYYDSGLQVFTQDLYDLARKKLPKLEKIIQSEEEILQHIVEGENHLYSLAVELEPRLAQVKAQLEAKHSLVKMTGSGGGFMVADF